MMVFITATHDRPLIGLDPGGGGGQRLLRLGGKAYQADREIAETEETSKGGLEY
jgi:hypothetical protein